MLMPAEIIKKKRAGLAHSSEEISEWVTAFAEGQVPDYQMSAWLMAVFFKGMTPNEIAAFTRAMMFSGDVLDFSSLPTPAVDKHSTGGVGDKTSLILAPIVAAAGLHVPMIAGRALGHTGGTIDKLEAIPGFRVDMSLDNFKKQVAVTGLALMGQTDRLCPADKKMYALRDVTGTVESLPLICGSIMSKKLAEGIDGLVLDVKYGSGAFMKTLEDAERLADLLIQTGKKNGKKMAALLTSMEQPLGRFIGNAVEVGECLAIMQNQPYLGRAPQTFADTRELTLALAAEMLCLGGKAGSPQEGLLLATEALDSGHALQKFYALCQAQGGRIEELPLPQKQQVVLAPAEGFVTAYNTEKIGLAAIALGAGRTRKSDVVDLTAGIEVHKKLGDSVRQGEPLFTLYGKQEKTFSQAQVMLLSATTISLQKTPSPSLITLRKV